MLLADTKDLGGNLGGAGLGPFGLVNFGTSGQTAGQQLGMAISAIVGLLTVSAGLWFLFQLVIGAIQWVASGGDKAGLEQARERIINGIIGLIIIVAAVALVSVISTFLGFQILNPASFLDSIKFQ